jgi:hypothetical protein
MGYASIAGFRASICSPFPWYNLEDEVITKLMLHPFAYMEGTYKFYQSKTKSQMKQEVQEFIKITKQVNGEFISLWHNDTLSEWKEWKGWSAIYEEMIKEVREK